MTPDKFLQQLPRYGLWLEVSSETGKLAIYGDEEKLTDRMCSYIQAHKNELVRLLLDDQAQAITDETHDKLNNGDVTQVDGSPIASESTQNGSHGSHLPDEPQSGLRYLACHLAQYGLCSNQVIEQDESTWRMSPDGSVFCLKCWQSRNLEQAERAHDYLAEHDQPTDLSERIAAIMSGPGYACCGGHDWIVDYTGVLVCRCVLRAREAREASKQRVPARVPGRQWEPTGQEKQCSICHWKRATIWTFDTDLSTQYTGYCKECFEKKDQAQASAA